MKRSFTRSPLLSLPPSSFTAEKIVRFPPPPLLVSLMNMSDKAIPIAKGKKIFKSESSPEFSEHVTCRQRTLVSVGDINVESDTSPDVLGDLLNILNKYRNVILLDLDELGHFIEMETLEKW